MSRKENAKRFRQMADELRALPKPEVKVVEEAPKPDLEEEKPKRKKK